jgi:hypothetical protein
MAIPFLLVPPAGYGFINKGPRQENSGAGATGKNWAV